MNHQDKNLPSPSNSSSYLGCKVDDTTCFLFFVVVPPDWERLQILGSKSCGVVCSPSNESFFFFFLRPAPHCSGCNLKYGWLSSLLWWKLLWILIRAVFIKYFSFTWHHLRKSDSLFRLSVQSNKHQSSAHAVLASCWFLFYIFHSASKFEISIFDICELI